MKMQSFEAGVTKEEIHSSWKAVEREVLALKKEKTKYEGFFDVSIERLEKSWQDLRDQYLYLVEKERNTKIGGGND